MVRIPRGKKHDHDIQRNKNTDMLSELTILTKDSDTPQKTKIKDFDTGFSLCLRRVLVTPSVIGYLTFHDSCTMTIHVLVETNTNNTVKTLIKI